MKLRQIGPNVSEVTHADGTRALFSYGVLVAADLPFSKVTGTGGFTKSASFFSKTTSRHVSQWLNGAQARPVPHDELAKLVEGR